jgi:predicted ATPase/DNA-binding SARP family transcriptional activator
MEFRLLGPLEVRDGDRVLPLGGRKQRALLALLALSPNRVVSRERLIDGLWGDAPPENAVASVQVYVSRLRKLLPPGTLVTRPSGYLVAAEPESVDRTHFERLFEEGREALAHGNPERAAAVLQETLELWRGPALAEFASEQFARVEGARLESLRLAAVEARVEADLALGREGQVVDELEVLVGDHPLRERLRCQLMLALYRLGRQADALRVYRETRRMLVDELGIEPSAELQRLERRILTQDQTLASPARAELPRLPGALTPLVGRRPELAELAVLLRAPVVRLLTLVGPGGVGKTRLALAAAEPRRGVLVSLASLQDPALVRSVIAHTLGLTDEAALTDWLRPRELLLVLDNCEHLLAAMPLVAELLAAAPGLQVLATSRAPLNLTGERQYAVEPLPIPDATDLFIERAAAAGARLDRAVTLEQICRKLDCLPLAIELAAARTKTLPPEALLARLEHRLPLLTRGPRDLPARQRTLRATIDWSHDLLQPGEQALFARLAVFSGGCTLDAAETVCGASLETLDTLVDGSLLEFHDNRYTMLETIHEYATERLAASSAHDHERSHAEFFAAFAERYAAHRRSGGHREGSRLRRLLDDVAADHDNFRSALAWSLQHEPELAVRLFVHLHDFWKRRDFLLEGRRWAERALRVVDAVPPALRAQALYAAAELAFFSGDVAAAGTLYTRCLELARELGDGSYAGWLLMKLAIVDSARGDLPGARRQLEESLRVSRALGDERTTPVALVYLGEVERDLGNTQRAKQLLVEALQALRDSGTAVRICATLGTLGDIMLDEKAFAEAASYYAEGLEIARELGSDRDSAYCLAGFASAAAGAGAADTAARLWGAVEAIETRIQVRLLHTERRRYEEALGELDERLVEEGRKLELDAAVSLALDALARV